MRRATPVGRRRERAQRRLRRSRRRIPSRRSPTQLSGRSFASPPPASRRTATTTGAYRRQSCTSFNTNTGYRPAGALRDDYTDDTEVSPPVNGVEFAFEAPSVEKGRLPASRTDRVKPSNIYLVSELFELFTERTRSFFYTGRQWRSQDFGLGGGGQCIHCFI